MPPGCLPHLSHLSQRALIWSANLARSLLAPPSLCSMTGGRRLPALSRRWKTVAAGGMCGCAEVLPEALEQHHKLLVEEHDVAALAGKLPHLEVG